MTPNEIKSNYYNDEYFYVHHSGSTFKGTFYGDRSKNFDTTFGNNNSRT